METLNCGCGCGNPVRTGNTYLNGHNSKRSGKLELLGKKLYLAKRVTEAISKLEEGNVETRRPW